MASFDLADSEWGLIEPILPNTPHGVPRVSEVELLLMSATRHDGRQGTVGRQNDGFSLKSRGKKPLASINTLVMEQIQKAPKDFLIHRLEDMISEKAPGAPKGLAQALAKHLANTPGEVFTWDDGVDDGPEIDLTLTAEEVIPHFEEAIKFAKEDLPKIIPELVKSAAAIILKSLKADWPAQRAHDEARMTQFCVNLRDRWGSAFDTLRMMYTISIEIGDEIVKNRRRSHAKKDAVLHDTLVHLHARACQVVLEIITLMENGLADGAMARWRTLHEITIVTTFLVEHGEELAIRYRAHEVVEAKRAMDRFVLYHEQLGYAPPTKMEINKADNDYRASLALYGDNFGSEYGWAAHHLKIKKPRLVDLEAAVGKAAMQSYYRMASYNVHAGSRGIAFRLGLLDGERSPTALAGASNAGFVDPAENTAHDLAYITALLANGTTRFDRMVEWQVLGTLRDELLQKVQKAQRKLESDHRAQLKIERNKITKKGSV